MKKQSFFTFLTQLVSENIVEVKKSSGQDYKMQKLNFFTYYAMTNKLSSNLLRNKFCIGIEVQLVGVDFHKVTKGDAQFTNNYLLKG